MVATCPALLVGCFFFNSEWGQREDAERRRAQRATPQLAREARPTAVTTRTVRLRVYATVAYRARTLQWTQRIRQAMDDVNALLSDVGLRVVIVDTQEWDPQVSEDQLDPVLTALRAHDPADDVDWVVGLVGSVPRLTQSFHDLGWAPYFSKHFVVRGANDQERQQIEEAFSRLDEAERDRLYAQRAAHKLSALFAHELAHTLGAPHVRSEDRVMFPNYSIDVLGFDAPTVALLKLSLALRFDAVGAEQQRATLRAIRDHLKAHLDHWREPEAPIAAVESMLASMTERVAATSVQAAAPSTPVHVAGLPDAARADFARAQQARAAASYDDAWVITTDLIARFPDVYPIAELHCDIANRRRLSFEEIERTCEPMMRLATQGAGARP